MEVQGFLGYVVTKDLASFMQELAAKGAAKRYMATNASKQRSCVLSELIWVFGQISSALVTMKQIADDRCMKRMCRCAVFTSLQTRQPYAFAGRAFLSLFISIIRTFKTNIIKLR